MRSAARNNEQGPVGFPRGLRKNLAFIFHSNQFGMSTTHIFNVEMTCDGCSGAVERVLNRLKGKGVDSFSVSLTDQKVTVTSALSADELLEVIKKTGKTTMYVGVQ